MLHRFTLALWLAFILEISLPLEIAAGAPAGPDAGNQAALQEAASWILRENEVESEYHYVMTCKLRMLLFWAGRDDVGAGYVRIGKAAERQRMIQVLFGSDPAKAPLAINRWGAGTEVLRSADSVQPAASAFFGFMKSSKGQSALAMRKELSQEKSNGAHLFEGIISRVEADQALSTAVPFASNQDFNMFQYKEAEKATLQQLGKNPSRRIRRLDGAAAPACPRLGEFLSTTLELIDAALADRPTPSSLCYIYNARHYTATLLSVRPVAEKTVHVSLRGKGAPAPAGGPPSRRTNPSTAEPRVAGGALDRSYRHLKDAHFEVVGQETGTKSYFDILLGTEGSLRGSPLQITYQPNWWFQVILNLTPDSTPTTIQATGVRPGAARE
jgi:hypothetical protein